MLSSPRKLSVGPRVVAFGGVVEHHVEDDLDARPVQRLDHVAKLVDRAERILARAVRLVRREERNRRIAPVVDEPGGAVLGVELEDRQQFDRGDAELLQIRNLLDQAGIRAARLLRDAGAGMAGEAAHVHLVDDGPRGRALQRRVPFPVVRVRIHHHALHRCRGVVAFLPRGVAAVVLWNNHARGRKDRAGLCRDQTAFRSADRTVPEPDSRRSARLHARHEDVPVVIGAVS